MVSSCVIIHLLSIGDLFTVKIILSHHVIINLTAGLSDMSLALNPDHLERRSWPQLNTAAFLPSRLTPATVNFLIRHHRCPQPLLLIASEHYLRACRFAWHSRRRQDLVSLLTFHLRCSR